MKRRWVRRSKTPTFLPRDPSMTDCGLNMVEHGLKIRLLSDCCCCLSLQVLLAIATCPNQDPAELARYDSCILGEANVQIASNSIFFHILSVLSVFISWQMYPVLDSVDAMPSCSEVVCLLPMFDVGVSIKSFAGLCNCQRELPQTHFGNTSTHSHGSTRTHCMSW